MADFLPLLMFLGLFSLFLLGLPIAFSLMSIGIIFGFIGDYMGLMSVSSFASIPENIWGRVMMNDTLLAIPFFTLMGLVLERCGIAEDLLDNVAKLFGPLRGGLAYAVILVGSILAATTGIVAASVMAMGLIALPIMLRYGYDRKIACGTIAASGTLAQIVPPSLVLIILADQLGKSVGDMYQGALLPSIMLIGLYCGYIFITSIISPDKIPPAKTSFSDNIPHRKIVFWSLPIFIGISYGTIFLFSSDIFPFSNLLHIFLICSLIIIPLYKAKIVDSELANILYGICTSIIPPILLIFLVLGTIFSGIATPTEAGAAGAVGALILSIIRKKLNMKLLHESLEKTVKLSTFVMFILIGARIFTLTFYHLNGHHFVEGLFGGLPGGVIGFLIVVNIIIFFLAFFLDFFELVFILVPLLAPIATKLGIDLIWFGVILGLNLQTSFMHPPFGFSLFFLRSVAPKEDYQDSITNKKIRKITTKQIYYGAIPFLAIQLIMVLSVILFPELTKVDNTKIMDISLLDKQLPILSPMKDPLDFLSDL